MYMEGWIKQGDVNWVCKRVHELEQRLAECEPEDRNWILAELASARSQMYSLLGDGSEENPFTTPDLPEWYG